MSPKTIEAKGWENESKYRSGRGTGLLHKRREFQRRETFIYFVLGHFAILILFYSNLRIFEIILIEVPYEGQYNFCSLKSPKNALFVLEFLAAKLLWCTGRDYFVLGFKQVIKRKERKTISANICLISARACKQTHFRITRGETAIYTGSHCFSFSFLAEEKNLSSQRNDQKPKNMYYLFSFSFSFYLSFVVFSRSSVTVLNRVTWWHKYEWPWVLDISHIEPATNQRFTDGEKPLKINASVAGLLIRLELSVCAVEF